MFNLVNRILTRLHVIKPKSLSEQLIANGNIRIGKNSSINNLSIVLYKPEKNRCNIIIGDDCLISGTITIYNADSKVKIGDRVFIGDKTELYCNEEISIESDVMLSWGITVIDTNSHSLLWEERRNDVKDWIKGSKFKDWSKVESKPVKIGSKSWIGFKSIILKGVSISEGTIVGAGSVVTANTESFTIVGGNPAKFIKKIN
jgi:acetyltransferase-like isoleucine patch superfamily enzyme